MNCPVTWNAIKTLQELFSSGIAIDEISADYDDLERADLIAAAAFAARWPGPGGCSRRDHEVAAYNSLIHLVAVNDRVRDHNGRRHQRHRDAGRLTIRAQDDNVRYSIPL